MSARTPSTSRSACASAQLCSIGGVLPWASYVHHGLRYYELETRWEYSLLRHQNGNGAFGMWSRICIAIQNFKIYVGVRTPTTISHFESGQSPFYIPFLSFPCFILCTLIPHIEPTYLFFFFCLFADKITVAAAECLFLMTWFGTGSNHSEIFHGFVSGRWFFFSCMPG